MMLVKWTLAAGLLIALAGGAAAQEMCGDPPIAPLIPSVADMQHKPVKQAEAIRLSAFIDIRKWQSVLKSYRDCLNATVETDKRAIGEEQRESKPSTDKIARLRTEITDTGHAWDSSVDEEEHVVNEFHAALTAYCTRKDVDLTVCPKT